MSECAVGRLRRRRPHQRHKGPQARIRHERCDRNLAPCVAPRCLSCLDRIGRSRVAASAPERPSSAGARMRARSAEEQILDRRPVARPAEQRARDEQLIERQLAVEDVAAGQAVRALEVERRDHLARDDRRVEARRVLRDRARRRGAEAIALGVPGACRAGDTARTARTRRRRAAPAGASDGSAIDGIVSSIHGSSAKPPYFAASNARSMASMSRARRMRPESAAGLLARACERRDAREPRQRGHRVVDLAPACRARGCSARAARTPAPGASDRASPSSVRFGSALETTARAAMRVAGRRASRRWRRRRPTSMRATSALGPDLDAGLPRAPPPARRPARRCRRRRTSRSRPGALRRAPSISSTRGAAGRPRAEKRSEDAAGGDRRAQRLALEPLAGEVGDRHRHPAQQTVGVGLAERAERAPGFQQLDQIAGGGIVDRRRRRRRDRAQHAADLREAARGSAGTASASFAENARIDCARARGVVPQHQRAAVERRRARVGRRPHDPQAVLLERRAIARARDRSPRRARASDSESRGESGVRAQPPARSVRSRTSVFSPALARAASRRRDR